MDINRVLQSRANRQTRLGKPFHVFYASFSECHKAAQSVLDGSSALFTHLIERSVVITMVTAIEVYYKDMLDGIFRVCSPDFFHPLLPKLHRTKYDILDLIELYSKRVHPLELISANQSFQNVDAIDAVFAKFLGKSLWTTVINMEVRVEEEPENVGSFSSKDLDALKDLFLLRHEIVHNPCYDSFLNKQVTDNVVSACWMVFGTDIVLIEMISDHKDPTLSMRRRKKA
jgi:hypothetical protein